MHLGGAVGTYDGVTFTVDEECAAVAFLNTARYSEMYSIPEAARQIAYTCVQGLGCGGPRPGQWSDIQSFSNTAGVDPTAIQAVKTASSMWSPKGLPYDTVANTWTNRTSMVNVTFWFDKVYVNKALPQYNDGTNTWNCAQLRDTPTATNYFTACFQLSSAAGAPTCASGDCFSGKVGTYVSARGTLVTTSQASTGGYRINLYHEQLGAPNLAIP